jgi:hypothetical protein
VSNSVVRTLLGDDGVDLVGHAGPMEGTEILEPDMIFSRNIETKTLCATPPALVIPLLFAYPMRESRVCSASG